MFKRKEIKFEEKIAITELCARQAENATRDGIVKVSFLKAVYDVALLAFLGENITDGVSYKNDGGVCNFEINISFDKLIEILGSKHIKHLKHKIKNYTETWNEVLESVKLYNIALAVKSFGDSLPTIDEMNKQVENMKSILDGNKKILETAVQCETKQAVREQDKMEYFKKKREQFGLK